MITAWEAITVAAVASRTIGRRAQLGASRKNGLLMCAGSSRISAPWPMYDSTHAGKTWMSQPRVMARRPKWPMSA